jgi:hypothetical protein
MIWQEMVALNGSHMQSSLDYSVKSGRGWEARMVKGIL